MCGIVGFITAEKSAGAYARRRFLTNALLAGVVRGDDGTGVFMVRHQAPEGEAADWAKLGDDASHFLRTEPWRERVSTPEPSRFRAIIGHNRAATVGSVSTANAHPFQEGPITLVHNGTLTSTYGLPKGRADLKGVDVDSHIITHNLAVASPEEVVAKLDGAFVLVWHDARDQSVNIVRNEKRPLHIMRAKCEDTLLIASEAEMLEWLVVRGSDFKPGEIHYPEPGQWLKFTPDGGTKPRVKKLALYAPTYSYGYSGRGYSRNPDVDDDSGVPAWYSRLYNGREASAPKQERETPPTKEESAEVSKAQSKLPTALTKTLKRVGLEPTDRLRFRVTRVARIPGTKYVNVYGALVDLNRMGIIHTLLGDAVKNSEYHGEMWTVLPCGAKSIARGPTEPEAELVVCRLFRRSVTSGPAESPPSSTESSGDSGTTTTGDAGATTPGDELAAALSKVSGFDPDEWEFFDGDGKSLNYVEWLRVTRHGCLYCSTSINPLDEEMEWDVATGQPICGECVAELELYSGFSMDDDDEDDVDYDDSSDLPPKSVNG